MLFMDYGDTILLYWTVLDADALVGILCFEELGVCEQTTKNQTRVILWVFQ